MTDWKTTYDGVFFISIATLFSSVIGLAFRFCFKSKCSKCKCCCIEIQRDIQTELVEDLEIMKNTNRKQSFQNI